MIFLPLRLRRTKITCLIFLHVTALWGNTLTSVDEASRSRVSVAIATSQVSSLPSVTAEKLGCQDNIAKGYFEGGKDGDIPQGPQPDLSELLFLVMVVLLLMWVVMLSYACGGGTNVGIVVVMEVAVVVLLLMKVLSLLSELCDMQSLVFLSLFIDTLFCFCLLLL